MHCVTARCPAPGYRQVPAPRHGPARYGPVPHRAARHRAQGPRRALVPCGSRPGHGRHGDCRPWWPAHPGWRDGCEPFCGARGAAGKRERAPGSATPGPARAIQPPVCGARIPPRTGTKRASLPRAERPTGSLPRAAGPQAGLQRAGQAVPAAADLARAGPAGAAATQAGHPDAPRPDAPRPDAQQPDAPRPDAQQPEPARPKATPPGASQPERGRPEPRQLEAGQLRTGLPEARRPQAPRPAAGLSRVGLTMALRARHPTGLRTRAASLHRAGACRLARPGRSAGGLRSGVPGTGTASRPGPAIWTGGRDRKAAAAYLVLLYSRDRMPGVQGQGYDETSANVISRY
jgi:hypothetical protein